MDQAALGTLLLGSMSPNPADIKASETQLTQAENQAAGALLMELLTVVFTESHQVPIRQCAAIFSKNLLKRRWVLSSIESLQHTPLDDGHKEKVRALLIDATCGPRATPLPRQIQSQVNAIISFIADMDFPKHWPSLLPSLVQTLNSSPSNELRLNALTCLCSVFKKYKTVSRSNDILMELRYLLPLFEATHLQLFTSVLPGIIANPTGTAKEVFAAMEQIFDIFYSLNVIDIPEFYQDNINAWMMGFLQILSLPHSNSGMDEPGPIETLKSLTCDNLALYADKYQEPFEPFVPQSVKAVWSLLVALDCNEARFDQLVASGIRFLSSTANTRWSQSPFEEQEALVQICEKLVLPNIQLRDVDVDLFIDNPDDYIRKDLQNADAETRRRSAVDLVKSLSKFYEEKITVIITHYIENLLKNFTSNYRARDACIELVTAVAAKGETRAMGVSVVNPKVDVNAFFSGQILPELVSTEKSMSEDRAVFKASCIKFLILFRNRIDKSLVNQAFTGVLSQIHSGSPKVVQCYAASCGFLLLSVAGVAHPSDQISAAVSDNALGIIIASAEQNEYLIKMVSKLRSKSPTLILKLVALIENFSANPINAVFTHYMFESLGAAVAAGDKEKARQTLITPLCQLLDKNIMEYIPYALQILALLIESSEAPQEVFVHLFGLLLNETLWKNPTLIPGIIRIMCAYFFKAAIYGSHIQGQLKTIAARFQLLFVTAKFEQAASDLINSLFTSIVVSADALQQILMAILTKLHTKRTEKLMRQFGVTLACLVANPQSSPEALIGVLEKIQEGLSVQVIKDLWMNAIANMNANTLPAKNRKEVFVSLAKLLASPGIVGNQAVTQAVLAAAEAMICVNPARQITSITTTAADTAGEDAHMEFEVSYTRLAATANPAVEKDFIPAVPGDGVAELKQAIRASPLVSSVPQLAAWAS